MMGKNICLDSSRNAKAVTRGGTRKYLVRTIGADSRQELIFMCSDNSNSILASQSESNMKTFRWEKLLCDFQKMVQCFSLCFTLLLGSEALIVGMCAAMILQYRYSKMSLVQEFIDDSLC